LILTVSPRRMSARLRTAGTFGSRVAEFGSFTLTAPVLQGFEHGGAARGPKPSGGKPRSHGASSRQVPNPAVHRCMNGAAPIAGRAEYARSRCEARRTPGWRVRWRAGHRSETSGGAARTGRGIGERPVTA